MIRNNRSNDRERKMKINFREKSPKSMKKYFKLDEYSISVDQGNREFYFV